MTNTDKLTTKYRKVRRDVGFTVNHASEGLKVGDKIMFESIEVLNSYINGVLPLVSMSRQEAEEYYNNDK